MTPITADQWKPEYDRWRHGGWYVTNIRYPSGAVGCVSRNYPDKKWRIVCTDETNTYPSRDAAARAERDITIRQKQETTATTPDPATTPAGNPSNVCQECGHTQSEHHDYHHEPSYCHGGSDGCDCPGFNQPRQDTPDGATH